MPIADAKASTKSLHIPTAPTTLQLSVSPLDTSAKNIISPKVKGSTQSLASSVKRLPPTEAYGSRKDLAVNVNKATPMAPAESMDVLKVESPVTPISPVSPTAAALINDDGPVNVDQVLSVLMTACMNMSLIVAKVKDGNKLFRKLDYIKDQYIERKDEIQSHEKNHFVQKWLWELRRAAVTFDDKTKKMKKAMLSTADGKRRKLLMLLVDVHDAWTELMMNVTLAIAGKSSAAAQNATGSVAKLAIAAGHPDWDVLDESSAMKICIQGDKYLFGYGVVRSYDLAFKRYMAAAKFGVPEASNMLGCMYEYGLGRDSDLPTAIYWYKDAASKKCAEAYNNLGRIFETGKGIPKDYVSAVDYYLKAAEMGHPDAQTNLGEFQSSLACVDLPKGFMLENAIGCRQDIKKAMSWYQLASDHADYARAQNCLGCIYYQGKGGVEKDYGLAIKYFRKAAEQGNAHAQNNMGICFEEGLGVVRDYAAAKEMYRKASEGNHPSGTNNLGYIYLLEKTYDQAMKTFLLAAALGSVDALFNIGTLYESGVLHPHHEPDEANAYQYYFDASNKSHQKAQLKLSDMLLKGKGVKHQDPVEAAKWLERCAALNNAEAMNRLGQLYEIGVGVEQNVDEAKRWYSKALALGNDGAMNNMGALYEIGVGVERNVDKALRLYQEAEKRGNEDARKRLDELREVVAF